MASECNQLASIEHCTPLAVGGNGSSSSLHATLPKGATASCCQCSPLPPLHALSGTWGKLRR